MQNLQKIIETIQQICSEKNISVNKALTESGVGKDLVVNMRKGQIPAINKIADLAIYLEVSTDRILGLSEQKQVKINESEKEKEKNEMKDEYIIFKEKAEKNLKTIKEALNFFSEVKNPEWKKDISIFEQDIDKLLKALENDSISANDIARIERMTKKDLSEPSEEVKYIRDTLNNTQGTMSEDISNKIKGVGKQEVIKTIETEYFPAMTREEAQKMIEEVVEKAIKATREEIQSQKTDSESAQENPSDKDGNGGNV